MNKVFLLILFSLAVIFNLALAEAVESCPVCDTQNGNIATVVVNENVVVNFNNNPPTCTGDLDLCALFTFDKSGATADKWKAIFNIGDKKLLIKDGAIVTVSDVPLAGSNRRSPGIEIISTCGLEIEPNGSIIVDSNNQLAGNILIRIDGNITINGTVSNIVRGTNGFPGNISIVSKCGQIVTGNLSKIETVGTDPGGSDISLAACKDIKIKGLVEAFYKGAVASKIDVVSFNGSIKIDGTTLREIEKGTSRRVTTGVTARQGGGHEPLAGTINIQANEDIIVIGNHIIIKASSKQNYGAVAVKPKSTNGNGGEGDINALSLNGKIIAVDRAFDFENKFNEFNEINLLAKQGIRLNVTGKKNDGAIDNAKAVVSTRAPDKGQGGKNALRSYSNSIVIGKNSQVLADATDLQLGTNGTNKLTSCTGIINDGLVAPKDQNNADDIGVCSPNAPNPIFPDSEKFGLNCIPESICGDGRVDFGEQCDDGNTNNNDACKNDCTNNICGDGFVNPATEQCDDGNNINSDGCSANCKEEFICPFGNTTTINFGGFRAGTIIDNEYSGIGVTISADNNNPSHPDKAIIFNSSNPTGGDTDLGTPNQAFGGPGIGSGSGAGTGNTKALGNILIIAENIADGNSDGFVDNPDDEANGGQFIFTFNRSITIHRITAVDIDTSEKGSVRAFDNFNTDLLSLQLVGLGDNSVQTLKSNATNYSATKLVVNITGSGAIDDLVYCEKGPRPCQGIDCSSFSDQCNIGFCNVETNQCELAPKPRSTSCNTDNNSCTTQHCNGQGACVVNFTVQVPQPEQCKSFFCDPADGQIKPNASGFPLSTPCEAEGNLCTIDHCNGAGQCVFKNTKDCSAFDGQCQRGACNPGTGACFPDFSLFPFSTFCETDVNICTIQHCDSQGSCVINPEAELPQECKLEIIKDSKVSQSMPTFNFGLGRYMIVNPKRGAIDRAYLRVDVSPLNNPVASAKMKIYVYQTGGNASGSAIQAWYCRSHDFVETTINWNNQPFNSGCSLADTIIVPNEVIAGTPETFHEFDLLNETNFEVNNDDGLFTIVLRSALESTGINHNKKHVQYLTKDYPEAAFRPKFEVTT